MDKEIIWTEPAWADVVEVVDYISKDSTCYAVSFMDEVKNAADSLATFAERGQIVPEFRDESIRELLIRSYRLVYKIEGNRVFVLTFIHGAQRPWRF